jgi:hypothetical protein
MPPLHFYADAGQNAACVDRVHFHAARRADSVARIHRAYFLRPAAAGVADSQHRGFVVGSAGALPAGEILVAMGRLDARDIYGAAGTGDGGDFSPTVRLGRAATCRGRCASALARTGGSRDSVSAKLGSS